MSLFGDLPPPSTEEKPGDDEQKKAESLPTRKSWATPAFAPNLKRQRAPKLPKNSAVLAAFSGTPSNTPSETAATPGVPRQVGEAALRSSKPVKAAIPALNPKHPHALPSDPQALISQWSARQQDHPPPPPAEPDDNGTNKPAFSLLEYLPVVPKQKRRGVGIASDADFDPSEEYNPAVPTNYQMYCRWLEREHQLQLREMYEQEELEYSGLGAGKDGYCSSEQ
ncbi:hypothetical protein FBU59_004023 [Linderina macrospora]|uniref:Uncharacterized protein n=1 Tax=Linderina macrospora TaxID=4868 RepID=A0ACC1J6Y6_9FUNG|nr:hypothetical protein FBU59_004023 [Linderina macrospora]